MKKGGLGCKVEEEKPKVEGESKRGRGAKERKGS